MAAPLRKHWWTSWWNLKETFSSSCCVLNSENCLWQSCFIFSLTSSWLLFLLCCVFFVSAVSAPPHFLLLLHSWQWNTLSLPVANSDTHGVVWDWYIYCGTDTLLMYWHIWLSDIWMTWIIYLTICSTMQSIEVCVCFSFSVIWLHPPVITIHTVLFFFQWAGRWQNYYSIHRHRFLRQLCIDSNVCGHKKIPLNTEYTYAGSIYLI